MADGKTRSVSVVFQAFTDKFQTDVKKAGIDLKNFAIGAVSVAALGAAAYRGMEVAVTALADSFERLDRVAKISKSLEVSPEFIQGLDLAASQTGESFDKMQDSVKEFNLRMGEAKRGTGAALEGLEILGFTIDDFNNSSPEEGYLKVADAISKIEDPQLKIFAAGEVFGGAGEELINLFNKGEDGLRSFIEMSNEFGGPISKEELNRIEVANNAIDRMTRSFEGIVNQLAIRLAPAIEFISGAITILVNRLQEVIDKFTRLTGLAKVLNIIDDLSARRNESSKKSVNPLPPLKIAATSIKSFSDAARAGSSKAFDLLNPNVSNSVANQTLKATEETNSILQAIRDEDGINFKEVSI